MGCGCRGSIQNNPPTVPSSPSNLSQRRSLTPVQERLNLAVPVVKSQGQEQIQKPGIGEKRKYNILDVVKDRMQGNLKYVSKEVMDFRSQVCNQCPKKIAGICSECGCVINFKVRYSESSCPIGKW